MAGDLAKTTGVVKKCKAAPVEKDAGVTGEKRKADVVTAAVENQIVGKKVKVEAEADD